MRRTNAILVGLFSMIAACGGSEAQEPREALVAAAPSAALARAASVRSTEPEPSVAEMNVPWAIALLSDAPEPQPRESARKLTLVVTQPDAPEDVDQQTNIQLAIETRPVIDKPIEAKSVPPKVCPGVVNRRS